MTTTLDAECRVFDDRLPEMLREHRGEFVLIHRDQVLGFFAASDLALAEGYRRFGVAEAFLVQEVAEPRVVSSSALLRGRPA